MTLYIILLVIAIFYFALIASCSLAWFSIKNSQLTSSSSKHSASVIVPVRNEKQNINKVLECLISQDYPFNKYEIIVSDDNSTDNTVEQVERIMSENPNCDIKLLRSNKQNSKKQALAKAIEFSQSDLIITTDADCRINKNWLSSVINYYYSKKIKMLVSPVVMNNSKSIFSKLQSLEFASLISCSAAAIKLKKPIMSNGANLAFSKKAYTDVKGYNSNMSYLSGDDIFLLQKIKKLYGSDSIAFLKNTDAIVFTDTASSFKEFYNQRIRWVSKSKGYSDFNIIAVALIILFFNISILGAFALSIFDKNYIEIALGLLVFKIIIDFPILAGFTRFIKKPQLLWYYLLLQPIYVVYISVFGVIGNFFSFDWKGRKNLEKAG